MAGIITLSFFLLVIVFLVGMTFKLRSLLNGVDGSDSAIETSEPKKEGLEKAQSFVYGALVAATVGAICILYYLLKGTIWEGHLMEWLNVIIRLMHFIFGIAWIGASFYFVFLENALNRTDGVREELAGNLWAVHGGGFYYLEKYKVAPNKLPKHLHWFKYEAYFTWLTGFSLLFVVYYFNASAMLIDKQVLDISPLAGIGIGIGSFLLAWFLYDRLCRSALVKNQYLFACIGFLLLTIFAFGYSQLFNSRAAYIHFGAMIGSIMVANVFFIIIPSQKLMVKAAKKGMMPDPSIGKHALMRSIHNNYFTLPVLFVMVSNHFPSTFGNEWQWVILMVITLGTAGAKHYMNLREKGKYSVWVLPVSILILLGAAFLSAPQPVKNDCKEELTSKDIMPIIQQRCASCHASNPTDDVYTAPPNGVKYDTPDDIIKLRDKIMQRVVVTKTMPPNNKTDITDEERKLIGCWIEQGAEK
jgi:uncharacterized membrane protein